MFLAKSVPLVFSAIAARRFLWYDAEKARLTPRGKREYETMTRRKPWLYVVLGVLVLLCAGMVYAWSVLSAPIARDFPKWSAAQLSLAFTLVMISFCLGGLVGGALAGKLSQKTLLLIAAALFFAGFFFTGRIQTLAGLYLSFGLVCGLGSGLAYNAVIATVNKWFPGKQGLVSGILLMGFGLSSLLIGKLYQALTPETVGAWRASFTVLGVATALCVALCGLFLEKPGADFAVAEPARRRSRPVNPVAMEATTAQMLRQGSFWLFYLWAILLTAAGLAIVSQSGGMARELNAGISASTVATLVGLIAVCNALGRVLAGALYDRFGRASAMQSVNVLFLLAGGVLLTALQSGRAALLIPGFILGGLAYGGVTPTNTAFVSSYFGLKHFALNLPIFVTNLIPASFGSTVAGALYDASGSYRLCFVLVAALAAAGVLVTLALDLSDRRTLRRGSKS